MFRRFRWALVILFLATVSLLSAALLTKPNGNAAEPQSWQEIGAIQAVAFQNHMWIFVQIDSWRTAESKLASPSYHRESFAHYLFKLDGNDSLSRSEIPGQGDLDFHPSTSELIGCQDGVYALRYESLTGQMQVFHWDSGRFRPLTPGEGQRLLTSLSFQNEPSMPTVEAPLVRECQRSLVAIKPGQKFPIAFQWADHTYELNVSVKRGKSLLTLAKKKRTIGTYACCVRNTGIELRVGNGDRRICAFHFRFSDGVHLHRRQPWLRRQSRSPLDWLNSHRRL
jgi:hypothetical protein